MNVYATESIRNVVLLGHGGCGKTSLIESMAFTTGIIKRVRKVITTKKRLRESFQFSPQLFH